MELKCFKIPLKKKKVRDFLVMLKGPLLNYVCDL